MSKSFVSQNWVIISLFKIKNPQKSWMLFFTENKRAKQNVIFMLTNIKKQKKSDSEDMLAVTRDPTLPKLCGHQHSSQMWYLNVWLWHHGHNHTFNYQGQIISTVTSDFAQWKHIDDRWRAYYILNGPVEKVPTARNPDSVLSKLSLFVVVVWSEPADLTSHPDRSTAPTLHGLNCILHTHSINIWGRAHFTLYISALSSPCLRCKEGKGRREIKEALSVFSKEWTVCMNVYRQNSISSPQTAPSPLPLRFIISSFPPPLPLSPCHSCSPGRWRASWGRRPPPAAAPRPPGPGSSPACGQCFCSSSSALCGCLQPGSVADTEQLRGQRWQTEQEQLTKRNSVFLVQ